MVELCCRLEESARRPITNPFKPLCDIAFAVYRVLTTNPVDLNTVNTDENSNKMNSENANSQNAENLLEAVAHSKNYCGIFVTADCVLESGSYTIVPLSLSDTSIQNVNFPFQIKSALIHIHLMHSYVVCLI